MIDLFHQDEEFMEFLRVEFMEPSLFEATGGITKTNDKEQR